jgi:hypothetical protein
VEGQPRSRPSAPKPRALPGPGRPHRWDLPLRFVKAEEGGGRRERSWPRRSGTVRGSFGAAPEPRTGVLGPSTAGPPLDLLGRAKSLRPHSQTGRCAGGTALPAQSRHGRPPPASTLHSEAEQPSTTERGNGDLVPVCRSRASLGKVFSVPDAEPRRCPALLFDRLGSPSRSPGESMISRNLVRRSRNIPGAGGCEGSS